MPIVHLQTSLKALSRQNQANQICQTAKRNISYHNCVVILHFSFEISLVFYKSALKTVSSPGEELNLCDLFFFSPTVPTTN